MSKRKAESEHGAEHRAENLMNELLTSSDFNLEELSPVVLRWIRAKNQINKLRKGANAFNSSLSEFMIIAQKCGRILDDGKFGIAMDTLLEMVEEEMNNEGSVFGDNDDVLNQEFVLSLEKILTTTPEQVTPLRMAAHCGCYSGSSTISSEGAGTTSPIAALQKASSLQDRARTMSRSASTSTSLDDDES